MNKIKDDFMQMESEQLVDCLESISAESQGIKDMLENNPTSKILENKTVLVNELEVNRELKEQVMQVLRDRDYKVELDESELSNIMFKERLYDITKMVFSYSSFFGQRKRFEISLVEERVEIVTNIIDPYESTDTSLVMEYPLTKNEFIDKIKKLEIGEWRNVYDPQIYGYSVLDGIQWSLDIFYGDEIYEIHGSNLYPYNYDELKELFTLFDAD